MNEKNEKLKKGKRDRTTLSLGRQDSGSVDASWTGGVEDFVASMNFDMNIPKLPGKPFIDVAYISDDDVYYDFGWKFSFGPMQIIVPLYQSWDIDNPYPNDEQWIKDRMRFSLSISNISAGSLF